MIFMNYIKHVVVAGIFALMMPFMAMANDVGSISTATLSNTATGSTGVSLSTTFTLANPVATGEIIYFFLQDANTGDPSVSGFDFSNAYSLSAGLAADGAANSTFGWALTLTSDASASQFSVGIGDLVNTDTAGCYVLMMTTDTPNETAEYVESDPISIAGANCDETGGDNSVDTRPELENLTITPFGNAIFIDWDLYTDDDNVEYTQYSVVYGTDPTLQVYDQMTVENASQTVISSLDQSETYYVNVQAISGELGEESPTAFNSEEVVMGSKSIKKTRARKPGSEKIKKDKFTAQLLKTSGMENFIVTTKLEVRKGRHHQLVKRYKNIDGSKTKKVVKDIGLLQGHTYTIRQKWVLDMSTNEQEITSVQASITKPTKWSKYKSVKLKGAKE